MRPSNLEQILFYNQSFATDKTLEEKSSEIFEDVETRSFVDIHVQIHDGDSSSINPQKGSGQLYFDAASTPPSPVDHCHYLGQGPPRYVGSPGLHYLKISTSQDLRNIASVR